MKDVAGKREGSTLACEMDGRVSLVWVVVGSVLAVVNVITFALFWLDKRKAQAGKHRVRERTHLLWCALGGLFGAFAAMRLFRHKTRDLKFLIWFWGWALVWGGGFLALAVVLGEIE